MRAAGLALALVCGGTACSVIPTGASRAVTVDDVGREDPLDPPYARVIAMPPNPDWRPEQVVMGFQAAMASVDDPSYAVARQYLTGAYAKEWNPDSGVTVYQPSTTGDDGGDDVDDGDTEARITLKGTVVATIKDRGLYRPSDGPLDEPFTLVKEEGKGWRISAGPDGLLLSEPDVKRAYRLVDLYFLDSRREGLVIEQVQVPLNPASTFAKAVVERLLEGPSASLQGAVRTAFADGTRLIDVTTVDNRVVVNLTKGVSSDNVAAMSAQLAGTLSGIAGGSSFEVRIHGEPYYSSDRPLGIDAQQQLKFDPWMAPGNIRPFYLQDGLLRQLGKDNVGVAVPGEAGGKNGSFTHPAVSGHNLRQVAALSENRDGISVAPLLPDGKWTQWVTGKDLTPPSWDRYHSMWTVSRPSPQTSVVLRHYYDEAKHEVKQFRVAAAELNTVDVTALKVARDGVHVAVATRNAQGDEEVKIGTVIGAGADSRIDNLQTVVHPEDKRTITDIAWKDGKTLYVLTGKSELLEASLTAAPASQVAYPRLQSITALDDYLLAGAKDDEDNQQVLYWNATAAKWEPWIRDESGAVAFTAGGPSFPVFPLG
ncbi:hypothetical protein GCM10010156_67190 [Planobispora rosea]|uniref:GerMN domain-containing protein n=1 Tax=Planobispora rosea TaxID=35762 RepID=A0A8J3WHQ6_PLARO|nr:hypothetical protein GCM10010156_67190 [Planobispora rosea]GIH88081.1 hypothetical protein Pro02_64890 [Planobispora rosea]